MNHLHLCNRLNSKDDLKERGSLLYYFALLLGLVVYCITYSMSRNGFDKKYAFRYLIYILKMNYVSWSCMFL